MEIKNLKMWVTHMLTNQDVFSLINVANCRSGLLSDNLVPSIESFNKFFAKSTGIPILIPANKTLFYFEQKDVFKLSAKQILKTVYGIPNEGYVGFKHAFNEFTFLANFEVKEAYQAYVDETVVQNLNVFKYVTSLKKKFKHIGAFQTRNILHFGHEKIMQRMLEVCGHLVLNPVMGPKKTGDVAVEYLTDIFAYLAKSKYHKKISFKPIFANMFYAGPREAMHHTLMRQIIGFQHFSIGRDHAGA